MQGPSRLFAAVAIAASATISTATAGVVFSASTGVEGPDNNLLSTGSGSNAVTLDQNWTLAGYYDSYGLSRADVFGSSVSNPNGRISEFINSPSASTLFPYSAYVVTGAGRPGWYNPQDGAQWIAAAPNQQNGGAPVNPPGNYEFQLDLSKYVNPNGGAVHVSIGEINADNHYEIAVSGSSADKSYLAKPYANQETWGNPGDQNVQFTFSPKDGATLDVIVANANDQLRNGKYAYDKNPTGFLIDHLVVSQDAGSAPAQDKLTSNAIVAGAIAPGSGPVAHKQLMIAAPEPNAWMIMIGFLLIPVLKGRDFRTHRIPGRKSAAQTDRQS